MVSAQLGRSLALWPAAPLRRLLLPDVRIGDIVRRRVSRAVYSFDMSDKRSTGGVSILAPPGFAEAFKKLAADRSAILDPQRKKRRVSVQELHEEAVRKLLERLSVGLQVTFVASPFRRRQRRKAMWLDPALYLDVKETARRYDVSIATIVLTACLAYLKAHGVELNNQDNSVSWSASG